MTGFTTLEAVLAERPVDSEQLDREVSVLEARIRAHTLRELRRAAGLTQGQLAERMGISQRRVSAIERGRVRRAEFDTLRSYVQALDGSVFLVAEIGDQVVRIA